MSTGRTARWIAIVLLVVEGLSGLAVGAELLIATAGSGLTVPALGWLIPVGLVAYGAALLGGGIAMALGRAWGWWLAIGPVLAGLALLLILMITAGDDPVLLGGVAIWVVTLVALISGRPRSGA